MNIKHTINIIAVLIINHLFLFSSTAQSIPNGNPPFFKGADIGWLQQMEATGFVFKDSVGNPADCLDILQSKGINSLRFRLFVNPSHNPRSGHCSTDEVIAMCKRAKAKGFDIMLDFHYSDTWADPFHQSIPKQWKKHDLPRLEKEVYDYTYKVLESLKKFGITPTWVQVGNEIPYGMLFPTGKIVNNNFAPLAALLKSGYKAVKAVNDSIQVVIHIDRGNHIDSTHWFFKGLQQHQVEYDIIGLSYYPYWLSPVGHKDYKPSLKDLEKNIVSLYKDFGKPVMIVETGGETDKYNDDTYMMLIDLLSVVKSNRGLGVFYWEPQAPRKWSHGYALGCWDENGKPLQALDAFLK